MMSPKRYVDLSTKAARDAFAPDLPASAWPLQREVRPLGDAIIHVLLFQWQVLGTSSTLLARLLMALNADYDCWDIGFSQRGKDASVEVHQYCKRYGIPMQPWPWSKPASDYVTMNDWFMRDYQEGELPALPTKSQAIVTPATAVVTLYSSVAAMPTVLKNDDFTIEGIVPDSHLYTPWPAAIAYLSPADYHCFHSPISGRIHSLDLRVDKDMPYSVTVKPYVFQHINIMKRNRRAVIVIEREDGFLCAMVIIGGITVDSIRLEKCIGVNSTIRVGDKIGAFARGGSSIALFFSDSVTWNFTYCDALMDSGYDCKLACNMTLCVTE